MLKQSLYERVTNRILAELEKGAVPWVKPWKPVAHGNMPRNAVTERPYSGGNVILLWMTAQDMGYTNPRWLTFKQAKEAGGHIRAGEHGTTVIYVSSYNRKEEGEDGEVTKKRAGFLKAYTVFNVAQADGLPDKIVNGDVGTAPTIEERNQLAEDFVKSTKADIREGAGEAYFAPGKDFISMPAFKAFKSADHFYGTEFHELGHWTGHKSRLDRDLKTTFGTQDYAREELVAELTSAFLVAEFGFEGELRHAGYIDHWITLLKGDPKAFVQAAAKAQRAADFLRGLALAEDETTLEQAA